MMKQYVTFWSSNSSLEIALFSQASLFNVVGTLFFICKKINQTVNLQLSPATEYC